MKKILSALVLSLFLASCATPTVVNVVGPNDGAMTCNQLDTQIAMANKYADDARKEKDMGTGTNISALLFWLPGLWATHKNVEEAVSLFENDDQINEVFNQKFIRTIAAIRRVENQAYLRVISSWEREYLLLNV